jgi:hypothetical protein
MALWHHLLLQSLNSDSRRFASHVAKGPQRENCELEVLERKRDANNCYGQSGAQRNVTEEDPYPRKHKPYDITDGSEDGNTLAAFDILTKRQQPNPSDLETLHSEWDTDDRDTKKDPHRDVLDPNDQSPSEDNPQ